jgi:Zn-dependent M28 family amino/carboxypeptidase
VPDSARPAAAAPAGSAEIERLFVDYFESQGLATEPTAFDGRSDYGPFISAGIPAGGLFTGAEEIKTPEQAAIYGGVAGQPYDSCYHLGCDNLGNLNNVALDQMSDAAAHATITLAQEKRLFESARTPSRGAGAGAAAAGGHSHELKVPRGL